MRTLAEPDVKALLSVVADLAVLGDVVPFPPNLLRRVGELVGGADVSFTDLVFMCTPNDGDFDERDSLVLELLQPHLQARNDRTRRAAEAADALTTLAEWETDAFYDIVLCSEGGVLEFASSRSRRLLATYFGSENGSLPQGLRAGLHGPHASLAAEHDGRRLTVRATRSAGMLVLLLGEQDARLDHLTRRQLEVLKQVAFGATDAEVGTILGIAAATVKKHLEQVYDRLGVHTRTAATAVFLSRRD
jgi:DNA-binding CsgD family transcriptional regulator